MSYKAVEWKRVLNDFNGKTVYKNKWFSIVKRDSFYSLEYLVPQVVILPIVEASVLMVKVKRHLINDETWELPAGGGLDSEAPVEAARRELEEETGIYIKELSRFQDLHILSEIPGRSTELLLSFMIKISRDEFSGRHKCDDPEITNMRLFSIDELKKAMVEGILYLSSPIAIISRYIFENNL